MCWKQTRREVKCQMRCLHTRVQLLFECFPSYLINIVDQNKFLLIGVNAFFTSEIKIVEINDIHQCHYVYKIIQILYYFYKKTF